MDAQIKFSKPMQWFIIIGISLSGIMGLIDMMLVFHKGGLVFFGMAGFELLIIAYGWWLRRFLD